MKKFAHQEVTISVCDNPRKIRVRECDYNGNWFDSDFAELVDDNIVVDTEMLRSFYGALTAMEV